MMNCWCMGLGLATLVGVFLGTQGCAGCEDRTPASSSAELGKPQVGAFGRRPIVPFRHIPRLPMLTADAQAQVAATGDAGADSH